MSRTRKGNTTLTGRKEFKSVFLERIEEEFEQVKAKLAKAGWEFSKFVEWTTKEGRIIYALFERPIKDVDRRARRVVRRIRERYGYSVEPDVVRFFNPPFVDVASYMG